MDADLWHRTGHNPMVILDQVSLKRYRQLEKDWFERVTHGLDKDNERGRQIFDDYDDAHPIDKGFTEWEKSRVEEKLRRLNSIAKTNKPE